ncbi:MAG: class I SAM-dependent methyltransferase [Vicinamibacterales bacterium]
MTQPGAAPACRNCGSALEHTFCDLGLSPLANSYRPLADRNAMERFYPLHVLVCDRCFLVQLPEVESPEEIFSDYAYFSSYSTSWLAHAEAYVADMTGRLGLGASSQVVEIASNDGYLLQYFVQRGVPVLGVEPAANVAKVAVEKGVPSRVAFFGVDTAKTLLAEGIQADLLLGNNVLAHVPKLHDFVEGMRILLKPGGVITMEFPHLLQLMRHVQFDTIYHEHFSYFSLLAVEKVFAAHGLRIFDVIQLPTHGGSLRIFAAHDGDASHPQQPAIAALRAEESAAGLDSLAAYQDFAERVKRAKRHLLRFLVEAREAGKTVVGYGAPAKGVTLLNYCGVGPDLLDYTVDLSPHKQDKMLPGVQVPIAHPDRIAATRPDYVLILPWNLKDEIVKQMAHVRSWGGAFVVPIPDLQVLS